MRLLLTVLLVVCLSGVALADDPATGAGQATTNSWLDTISQGISSMASSLLGVLGDIFAFLTVTLPSMLFCTFIEATCFLNKVILYSGTKVLSFAFAKLPVHLPTLATVAAVLPIVNDWLPLAEGAYLLTTYWTFHLATIQGRIFFRLARVPI